VHPPGQPAGSIDYNAATPVVQSFTINAVAPSAPTLTAATRATGRHALLQSACELRRHADHLVHGHLQPAASPQRVALAIVVGGLANGTPYTCSVTATNAAGTGVASNTLGVTPTGAATAPVITSPASTTFTVTQAGTFTVVGTGNPAPTLSMVGGFRRG
jgi:hypothetical protein